MLLLAVCDGCGLFIYCVWLKEREIFVLTCSFATAAIVDYLTLQIMAAGPFRCFDEINGGGSLCFLLFHYTIVQYARPFFIERGRRSTICIL